MKKTHSKGSGRKPYKLYTVYNNRTDAAVIIDSTARLCAKAMGVSVATFYSTVTRTRNGLLQKWNIKSRYLDEKKRFKGWGKV